MRLRMRLPIAQWKQFVISVLTVLDACVFLQDLIRLPPAFCLLEKS